MKAGLFDLIHILAPSCHGDHTKKVLLLLTIWSGCVWNVWNCSNYFCNSWEKSLVVTVPFPSLSTYIFYALLRCNDVRCPCALDYCATQSRSPRGCVAACCYATIASQQHWQDRRTENTPSSSSPTRLWRGWHTTARDTRSRNNYYRTRIGISRSKYLQK